MSETTTYLVWVNRLDVITGEQEQPGLYPCYLTIDEDDAVPIIVTESGELPAGDGMSLGDRMAVGFVLRRLL